MIFWPLAQKTVRPAIIVWNHTVLAYGVIWCFKKSKHTTDKPLKCLSASNPSELYSVCNSIVIPLPHVSVYKLPPSGPLPGLYFLPTQTQLEL